jgi:hypothetical protein
MEAVTEKNEAPEPAKIKSPLDITVNLPGGYISPSGEVYRTAEVRELTGKDEEAIVKANAPMSLSLILPMAIQFGYKMALEEVKEKLNEA